MIVRADSPKIEPKEINTPTEPSKIESADVYVPLSERTLPAKIGHGIKSIVTSNALWNGIRITTSSLAIMGLISLGPLGITAVAVGLAIMVVSMGMDTAHTRTLRKLDQELSLLHEHAKLSQEQEELLEAHPKPAYLAPKTEHKAHNTSELGISETRLGAYGLKGLSTGRPLLTGILGTAEAVVTNLGKPIALLILKTAVALFAFSFDIKYQQHDLPATKKMLRDEIVKLRKKTPGYNSLKELKKVVSDQYARTTALKRSLEPGVEQTAEAYDRRIRRYGREYDEAHKKPFLAGVRRFLADFFHSQQPFSDFNNLDWIHDRVELRKRS